jgi:HK97 family phage prohead protease
MKETRQINVPAKVETRADGSVGTIHGYAIVYDKDSEDMGFIERVAPGAAKKALKRSDIRGLKNHDPSLIFARQGVNLKLKEDKNGLSYEATPIDTVNYREVAAEVQAGLLTGQSFGFTILADEWKGLDTDKPQRTITEIGEIFDVGPVTFPAYPSTDVGVRILQEARDRFSADNEPDIESVKLIINDEETVFTGESRFDEATEKIAELRSVLSPTVDDTDDTVPDPTIAKVSSNEFMDKINETLTRYEQ